MDIKTMTDEALIKLNLELYDSVCVTECYGTRDNALMVLTEQELIARGYEWNEGLEMWYKSTMEEENEP